tara:strand:+ start:69 stop:728 length:660 start_codon:yes stop_codon:yes gene_type:complete
MAKGNQNMTHLSLPENNCIKCPRLAAFRTSNILKQPEWHNAPVNSFGSIDSVLLIVGLAPGLKGANRTGRPFTGDFAGDLLYPTLSKFRFATGNYRRTAADKLLLKECRITNAVRCVPPKNKPTSNEINTCLPFLRSEIANMPQLKIILALGTIAHQATLRALNLKVSAHKFVHGNKHRINETLTLINSYHCSRLNTNTGRLKESMFHDIFSEIRHLID